MQQPPNPYDQTTRQYAPPPPQLAPPPPMPPRRPNEINRFLTWFRQQPMLVKIAIAFGALVLVIFVGSAAISGITQGSQGISPTPTAARQASQPTSAAKPTAKPTQPAPTATKAPVAHYPPKTRDDLRALAALGDASQIHAFHSESVGLTGVCPQPKTLVTVDPSLTGKKLAEDLLAYWYANGFENPCGAVVFAFHTQAEGNGDNGYTAGRVILKTADASGSVNLDPNATGLTYTLTLDTGDWLSAQDYDVSWQQ